MLDQAMSSSHARVGRGTSVLHAGRAGLCRAALQSARLARGLALAAGLMGVGGLGCATSSAVPGSAVPQGHAAADFYPLEAGWKWAYDLSREGDNVLATYAVLERTLDTAIVQAGEERLSYAITAQGIAQKEGAAIGDYVLKNPVAPGASWSVVGGRAKITSVDAKVDVPSGSYSGCVVVEVLRADPNRMTRTTFAPGVGPVAIEVGVESHGRFVTTMHASLRAATKPGQDPLAFGP